MSKSFPLSPWEQTSFGAACTSPAGPQAAVSTRNKSLAPIPGSWPGKVTEYSRP